MLVLDEVQQLRDDALIERLTLSVRNDRRLAVRMLVELGEVQERGLYRDLGFSSLFEFATKKLGMSEAEAGLRIRAAKVGRAFPVALEMLGRCELNLTTLSLLASVLTPETIHLLHASRFKSKQEVQALIATHHPKPDAPDSVRRLSPPRACARAPHVETRNAGALAQTISLPDVHASTNPTLPLDAARPEALLPQVHASTNPTLPLDAARPEALLPQVHASTNPTLPLDAARLEALVAQAQTLAATPAPATSRTHERSSPQRRAAEVVQLSGERHKISFTGSQRVRDLLQEAQDLRRHRYPAGDLEPLFERALELLVAEEKKRRFALTPKPRARSAKTSKTRSRHIPHPVQRQVWTRDAGQCRFVSVDGQHCRTRSLLQLHHVAPFGRGGASSADNVMLLCQAHNALYAERDYGRAYIERRIEHRSPGSGAKLIRRGPGHRAPERCDEAKDDNDEDNENDARRG